MKISSQKTKPLIASLLLIASIFGLLSSRGLADGISGETSSEIDRRI